MPRNWTPEQTAAMTVTEKTLLISAAAGSGKTATLTERIIRRVVAGADISRMLIVTFTKSAAAELRSRISDALTAAIAEHPDNHHLASQLVALGSADIQTIDSFCLGPVREHFERLELPASFRIADETEMKLLTEQLLQDTVTDLYERYANGQDGNRFSRFADHLMTAGETQIPYQVLTDLYNKLRNFPEGIRQLMTYAETYAHGAETEFLFTDVGRFFSLCVREEIGSYKRKLERAIDLLSDDENYVKGFFPLLRAELAYLDAILVGLDTSYAEAYLAARTPPGGSLTVKTALKTEIGTRVHEEHKLYRKGLAGLGKKYFSTPPEEIAEQFRETAEFCDVLYELFSEYDNRLTAEKRLRGICDFTDITRNMLSLLTTGGREPSDLAGALAKSYDEVYIDEYQDVNEMQDLIFSLIGGDHRFMVGDIKQCIYAFRGSEPSLFAEYRREFPAVGTPEADGAVGNSIFMSDNFRCDRSIIDFSNTVCRPLFAVCRDSIGYRPEDDLKKSKQDPYEGYVSPKVTVAYFECSPKDSGNDDTAADTEEDETFAPEDTAPSSLPTEAEWIADTVYRLLHGAHKADGTPVRASDIAILTRGNRPLEMISDQLQLRGIPTTFSGGSGLSASPEMKFLLNLLSVIDNPQSDVPLHETLLHPLFGFSEDELIRFRRTAEPSASLYDALCAAAERNTEASPRAAGFISWLDGYRRLSRSLPADRFLREMYRDPLFSELADSDAFLAAYDAARRYQNSISTGLYHFLGFFRSEVEDGKLSFRAGTAESDAVNMMTMHSSKGLEFPVCFLARCGTKFSMKDTQKEMIFERNIGLTCRLSDHTTLAKHSTWLRDCACLSYRRHTVEEEMRTLYVALTRARERLYVSATLPGKKKIAKLLSEAEFADLGDEFAIRSANSHVEWISAALAHADPAFLQNSVEQLIFSQDAPQTGETLPEGTVPGEAVTGEVTPGGLANQTAGQRETTHDSIAHATTGQEAPVPVEAERERPTETTPGEAGHGEQPPVTEQDGEPTDPFLRRIATARADEAGLEQKIRLLPAKIAASKVSADMADRLLSDEEGGDGHDVRARLELLKTSSVSFSSLLNEGRAVQATDRGTAAHEFLQFCDYARLVTDGTEAEFDRLVREKFITPHTAEIADRASLEKFLQSNLFRDIQRAESVEREVQFSLFLPYAEFAQSEDLKAALGDRLIHVQGSIDLLLTMPDGTLHLVDYKTDRIPAEVAASDEKLTAFFAARHTRQLSVYRRAVGHLYGKLPDKTMIYSIPLGKTAELPF